MALKDSVTINGVIISDCYIKVSTINGDKHKVMIDVHYKADSDSPPIYAYTFAYTPDLEGGNFIAQGYNYLKTLDQFQGAIDC